MVDYTITHFLVTAGAGLEEQVLKTAAATGSIACPWLIRYDYLYTYIFIENNKNPSNVQRLHDIQAFAKLKIRYKQR